MAGPFIPNLDLIRREQAIAAATTAARAQIIADRPGNPLGGEVRRFDEGAVAIRIPPFGEHLFNRAYGFTDDHLAAARDVVDWYAEGRVQGAFEIVPGLPTAALTQHLHEHGWRHTGFHAVFGGPARLGDAPPAAGVEVRRVETESDLEAFSEAYHVGWGHTGFRVPVAPWLTAPGWRLYLGLCDGAPAGGAILSIAGADAYLADGAVAPDWRRRGVHRALIDRRCADAAAAGAEVAFSGAEFLSGSHRNMLRKGLALLFTKSIWTAPPTT